MNPHAQLYQRMEPLLIALTEEGLSADQHHELAELLRGDDLAADVYAEYIAIHSLLRRELEAGTQDTLPPELAAQH